MVGSGDDEVKKKRRADEEEKGGEPKKVSPRSPFAGRALPFGGFGGL